MAHLLEKHVEALFAASPTRIRVELGAVRTWGHKSDETVRLVDATGGRVQDQHVTVHVATAFVRRLGATWRAAVDTETALLTVDGVSHIVRYVGTLDDGAVSELALYPATAS